MGYVREWTWHEAAALIGSFAYIVGGHSGRVVEAAMNRGTWEVAIRWDTEWTARLWVSRSALARAKRLKVARVEAARLQAEGRRPGGPA